MRTFARWDLVVAGVLSVGVLGGCGDSSPTEAEPPLLGSSPSMPALACTLPVQLTLTI